MHKYAYYGFRFSGAIYRNRWDCVSDSCIYLFLLCEWRQSFYSCWLMFDFFVVVVEYMAWLTSEWMRLDQIDVCNCVFVLCFFLRSPWQYGVTNTYCTQSNTLPTFEVERDIGTRIPIYIYIYIYRGWCSPLYFRGSGGGARPHSWMPYIYIYKRPSRGEGETEVCKQCSFIDLFWLIMLELFEVRLRANRRIFYELQSVQQIIWKRW